MDRLYNKKRRKLKDFFSGHVIIDDICIEICRKIFLHLASMLNIPMKGRHTVSGEASAMVLILDGIAQTILGTCEGLFQNKFSDLRLLSI